MNYSKKYYQTHKELLDFKNTALSLAICCALFPIMRSQANTVEFLIEPTAISKRTIDLTYNNLENQLKVWQPVQLTSDSSKQGVWVQATHQRATENLVRNKLNVGFQSNITQTTVGIDTELNATYTLGLAYSHWRNNLSSFKKINLDSYVADASGNIGTLYLSINLSTWFIDTSFSFGRSNNQHMHPKLSTTTNKPKEYMNDYHNINCNLGAMLYDNDWYLYPKLGVHSTSVDVSSKLSTQDKLISGIDTVLSLKFHGGFVLGYKYSYNNWNLEPQISFDGYHELKRKKQYTMLANQAIYGAYNDPQSCQVAFNFYISNSNARLMLSYAYGWEKTMKIHTSKAGVSYTF